MHAHLVGVEIRICGRRDSALGRRGEIAHTSYQCYNKGLLLGLAFDGPGSPVGISIPLLMLIPAHGRREACPGRVSKWTRTNILPTAQQAAT
jgi:hypothetical protein